LGSYYGGQDKIVKTFINPSDPSGRGNGYDPSWAVGTVGYGYSLNALSYVDDYFGGCGWCYPNVTPTSTSAITRLLFKLGISYPDGTSNTVILAERYSVPAGQPIPWGNPQYPTFDYTTTVQKYPAANAANSAYLQAPRSAGIMVGLADASTRFVASNIFNNTTWTNALRPNDGQTLGSDW